MTLVDFDRERQSPELTRVCLTVSQLNRTVAGTLQREFGTQRVRGEIATLTRAASGHWYFVLKDAGAQVRCVMFRGRNQHLDFVPRDGDEIELTATVSLYEARGEFQLTVDTLRRFGAGRLWEEFQKLRARLAAEGLFDTAIKRPLPLVPRAVGILTSLQAAALRDVLSTLHRRAPYLPLIVYPVPVQGAEAGGRIAAMMAHACARAEVDVLLLVRGGGSIEDLWAFNEEVVARAIRASTVPVIVGVGHDSDFTIADFAADVRAPTPTAAAELVAPERLGLLRELQARLRSLGRGAARAHGQRAQSLDHALRVLGSPQAPLRGLEARIAQLRERCAQQGREPLRRGRGELVLLTRALARQQPDSAARRAQVQELLGRLQRAARRAAQARREGLVHRERALEHLNVQGVLDRGFSILRDGQGRILTEAAALEPGAPVDARLARGTARLRVETVALAQDPTPAPARPAN